MSSKMQFQVFYGEYNVMYGPNGVDLSAFKRTSSGMKYYCLSLMYSPVFLCFNIFCFFAGYVTPAY